MKTIQRTPLAACLLLAATTACDADRPDAADETTLDADEDADEDDRDERRDPVGSAASATLTDGLDEPSTDQPGLVPGEPVQLEQEVPINIVLLGLEPDRVDEAALLAGLPETQVPRTRIPALYYGIERSPGVSFTFDYEVYHADAELEDALFEHLQQIGREGDPTQFQQLYNAQETNAVDVEGPVLHIDAAQAEAWLAEHTEALIPGARRKRGYTVYFIDWYGREDFRFHVYDRPDVVDQDTGVPFGELDSRKISAWGGTHHRGWFLDLSAGPESWTFNWLVDEPDVDGDGVPDHRILPSWEYAEGGHRSPAALADDLGLVTRFVAIDSLFTASPVYDPMVPAPGLHGRKRVHVEAFDDDGDPGASATELIDPARIGGALAGLQPHHDWEVALDVVDPIDEGARRTLRTFTSVEVFDGCWTDWGFPYFQLPCYFTESRAQYVPAYPANDSVSEVYSFATTDETMGWFFGVLGFADEDYVSGTQTRVYQFSTPTTLGWGYGPTDTIIHELGHHHGLSHPHDGYDSELGLDFGPEGAFFFTWLGSHSETVMHYLQLAEGFGTFDRDNLQRMETAGYLERATQSLALVEAWKASNPEPNWLKSAVKQAHKHARRARKKYAKWSYAEAAAEAKAAHEELLEALEALGITPRPVSAMVEPMPHDPLTCGVRLPGV